MATTMAKMRSALTGAAKMMVTQSKPACSSSTITVTSKLFTSHLPTRPVFSASRLASAMTSVLESEKPLHSAIASARLTSILALDSTSWSSLSQGSYTLPIALIQSDSNRQAMEKTITDSLH